jgi:membrane-associated protease RseP (regulator of RpoE activity)
MTDLDHRASRLPVPEPAAPQGERPGSPLGLLALAGLVVLAGLRGGWPLLTMIAALVTMIFLHELGHYLTAKWAGMKVTEFFIGFGPRIWSFRRGETEYGIKPLPLGAYVKIVGMHNLDEYDPADADRTYMSKPFWRRLSVAVAGSTMHFLLAFVSLVTAYALVGLPGGRAILTEEDENAAMASAPWVVEAVTDESGAQVAGVERGDRILAIDGVAVATFADFSETVMVRPGQVVPVVIERNGVESTLSVHIGRRPDNAQLGFFGVGPEIEQSTVALGEALRESGRSFGEIIDLTFGGLGHILSPTGLSELGRAAFTDNAGPTVGEEGGGTDGETSEGPQAAGIIRITDIGAGTLEDGRWGDFLLVFALVNVFIGVFNLVPLLPLDGGHVAIAVYEKVRSMFRGGEEYHVDVVKLLPVTYAAVLVLIFLGVSTVVLDTRGLVGG